MLICLALAAESPVLAEPTAYWAEGEQYTEQQGSIGPDRPPYAFNGACLGSNFGGAAGHYVLYRFRLASEIGEAVLVVRYARLADDEAAFEVKLDDATVGTIRFPPTGGWGHRATTEWAWASLALGRLAPGSHTLRLTSLRDRNNTNIDGFVIGPHGLAPPRTAEEAARLARLPVDRRDRGMYTDPAATIADFSPRLEDAYYPAEEPAEAAGMALPRVKALGDDTATLIGPEGATHALSVGGTASDWRLLAVTQSPRAAVLERRFARWGMIAYVGEAGPLFTVRLPVGEVSRLVADDRRYPAGYEDAILASHEDLLGKKVLAQGEPCYEAAAGLLPELASYVPVSSASAPVKVVIDETGRIGPMHEGYGRPRVAEAILDPAAYVGQLAPTVAKRGLLGGYLPGVDYGFWDGEARAGWEEIAFALDGEPERLFVALVRDGQWRTFALHPTREVPPHEFFEALAAFHEHWRRELEPSVRVDLPEPRLRDASLAAIARSMTTFVGDGARYGLGVYSQEVHKGFPPTTLWMVNNCLEWGLFGRARRYLTAYFDHCVRDDGTFEYYGPAVSEYGQVLDLVARYVRYTGDREWLAAHGTKVIAIARYLLSLRRESLKQPEGAVTRGLLYGSPEADTRDDREYYFSGTAWAWRGLLELARLCQETRVRLVAPEDVERECASLREDLLRAAKASLVPGDPPFLPPYPGLQTPSP